MYLYYYFHITAKSLNNKILTNQTKHTSLQEQPTY